MLRHISLSVLGLTAVVALAQPALQAGQRARITTRGTVEAVVDGVHVAMEYGRPTTRGREIWGALVPWGRWWMPGADETTSIATDAPLMVGTLSMPAGTHTIYTLPTADAFTLIINKQTGQFHTVYHPERDLGRVPMTLTTLAEPVEQMTFVVTPVAAGGGTLALRWDNREYAVSLRAAGRD
ncbi:MAG: DUF2911 domain-containing protein [Acidobacteriota bacterium]